MPARAYTSDPRDTSTPDDMAALLVRLQRGDLLPWPYGEQLIDRMSHAKTGPRRLKARLPPDTIVAHKTGTTDVVINDVGIITLPEGGGHMVLAVFVKNGGRGWRCSTRSRRSPRRSYEIVHRHTIVATAAAESDQGREEKTCPQAQTGEEGGGQVRVRRGYGETGLYSPSWRAALRRSPRRHVDG